MSHYRLPITYYQPPIYDKYLSGHDMTHYEELVAPRTPTEAIIADISALVLGLQQVGIHNNFFELGGHSLLATQVISRKREIT